MKIFFFFILLFSFISSLRKDPVNFPREKGIMVLTDDTFEEASNTYPFILLFFYAPWCGFCQSTHPQLEKIVSEVEAAVPIVKIAKIDGTYHRVMVDRYDIMGYPTILLLQQGKRIAEYNEKREADVMIEWLKDKTEPLISDIKSSEEYDKTTKNIEKKPLCVYYGNDTDELKEFESVAKVYKNYFKFAQVGDISVIEQIEMKKGTVQLFKNFDEKENLLSSPINYVNLRNFLMTYGHKMISDFTTEIQKSVINNWNVGMFYFYDGEKNKKYDTMNKVAKIIRDKMGVVLVDKSDKKTAAFVRDAEITTEALAIFDTRTHPRIYQIDDESINNVTEIVNFVNKWYERKTVPYIDMPIKLKKPVASVDTTSYLKDVIYNDYDVFIKIYAPWCQHCKKLAPIFEELAVKLNRNDRLKFVEIDGTENEIPNIEIKGYPTLILLSANKKNTPLYYEGERDVEHMEKFIKEKVSHPLLF